MDRLRAVIDVWEEAAGQVLRPSWVEPFLQRPQSAQLAAFSRESLLGAGELAVRRDDRLRLEAWLEQLRHDVYERSGTRSTGASSACLATAGQRMAGRQTAAEALLWQHLKAGIDGHKFRRQVPVKGVIPNFYCGTARLAVELDGSSHRLKGQADQRRDEFLRAEGVLTLRFSHREVFEDLSGVLRRLTRRVDTPAARARRDRSQRASEGRRTAAGRQPLTPTAPRVPAPARWKGAIELVPAQYSRRAFRCPECQRRFVAPVMPVPRCTRHPEAGGGPAVR